MLISPYHWIIQFRNDDTEEGKIAKIVFDDPNFTENIQTYEGLRSYLRSDVCNYDLTTKMKLRAMFHDYERKIQT